MRKNERKSEEGGGRGRKNKLPVAGKLAMEVVK